MGFSVDISLYFYVVIVALLVYFFVCVFLASKSSLRTSSILSPFSSEESFTNSTNSTTVPVVETLQTETNDDTKYEESSESSTVKHPSTCRESKVGSSLEYAYVDDVTQNIDLDDAHTETNAKIKAPPFEPAGNIDKLIIDPNVQQVPNKQTCPKPTLKNVDKIDACSNKKTESTQNTKKTQHKIPMYDEYLEPKPEVDSPYGFVYFPNKYWKQWQQKAPVCVPTNANACKVQAIYTTGVPVDVLDYTQIGSIMPQFKYSEEYQ